ncbi:hypothetical protein [Paenibacillus sp. MBLB4367]|uniref:hypothetical protein n=1 Tax=Paenibacillus sp. MBLB4367 TaxID=3384767 RepID=UPI0039081B94
MDLQEGKLTNWNNNINENLGGNNMYLDTMFQRTIIHSLLYARRKKIDKIACSENILNDYNKLIDTINLIRLDDLRLERKLEQTELNLNLILDGTNRNFTNDEVNSVKKINECFQWKKERFSDFKKDRLERESYLKEILSCNHDFTRKILSHLDRDDEDFLQRYETYLNFQYDIEDPLAKITLRKWEDQLTKPNEYRRGYKFKFLVHAISTDTENALQNAKSKQIISTSLITDEFQGTYKKSRIGFVYQPNKKNVLLISNSDCYANALHYTEKYVKAEYFSLTYTPLGADRYLHYSDTYACKTMHIEEIEKRSKELQKCVAEEIDGSNAYNEIVLINDPTTNPIAVFIIETENSNESTVGQAEELATKLNLPLLRI